MPGAMVLGWREENGRTWGASPSFMTSLLRMLAWGSLWSKLDSRTETSRKKANAKKQAIQMFIYKNHTWPHECRTLSYLSEVKTDAGNGTTSGSSSSMPDLRIDPKAPALLASTPPPEWLHSTIFPFTELLSRHPSSQLQYKQSLKLFFVHNYFPSNLK